MTEPYRVEVSPAVRRQLQRLPPRVTPALVDFVVGVLPEDPQRLSKPLRGELEGLPSARRGDYRVLFRTDESCRTLLIVRIAHRSDVYRAPVRGAAPAPSPGRRGSLGGSRMD